MKSWIFVGIICLAVSYASACTVTTASGSRAPAAGSFCSGQLIFEDNFDTLDQVNWRHEVTLSGGGNWEFQWYVNDRFNSYTVGGILHIKPTFTSDIFGEAFLTSARVTIPGIECTDWENYGCDRTGSVDNIINPIRSARISTMNSFSFKYGTLEIRAKMPAGDWIWPALWLMPRQSVYGTWPRSGEIDLMELRGNRNLRNAQGVHVGNEQAGSTLHFGPNWDVNGWETAHHTRNQNPGFDANFHVYKLYWTENLLQFSIDNVVVGTVNAGAGFWARGGFANSGWPNPWSQATIMAPFDQEFFVIMNVAAGGTNYFSDYFTNVPAKPWLNTSPRAAADFWQGRSGWEPTWNKGTDDSHMQVDYVRVWAL